MHNSRRMLVWLKRIALALLLIVVLVFALIGLLTVTRGTPVEYVLAKGDPRGPPATDDPLFRRTIELNTGVDLEAGNAVQVLENGVGTYPLLWQDIRTCRQTVTVQMYFAKPGAVADTMGAVLRECAKRGVRVLLLLDGFGAQSLTKEWRASLTAAGVEVAYLRQLRWYTLHMATERSHARVIVVDGRVAYTGGFGLADYWLGSGHKPDEWRETNVRFEGPAVAELQAAFAVAWAEATGELLTGDAFYPPVSFDTAGTVRAGLFHAVPSTGSTPAERFYALTIAGARKTLYITNAYFVPDDDFRNLLKAAAKRGVDVRILTTGPNTDVRSTLWAGQWRYPELLRAGVRIYEYQPANMHAKTLSADGVWGSVGSMNFDNRSLAFNNETTLLIYDRRIVAGMDTMFLNDLKASKEMTLAEVRRWPWWRRARSAMADMLERLL
ncbi:Phospholipase D-like domain protein [Gemmatirosa kalamazoonensis]|uniref:Phospholipase D-like domain protein n=1 Tax=Gemmatirosa kalamazoonensis TaxID=861299 RepID=W0RB27_9BACT|nr:phospholipase D-like domain-containing protein [Gemmatirosa kalamazoonensis]AHG87996.1 Phospholipase D-like domain protein [Gemmatirosa kalamazoonensis]